MAIALPTHFETIDPILRVNDLAQSEQNPQCEDPPANGPWVLERRIDHLFGHVLRFGSATEVDQT